MPEAGKNPWDREIYYDLAEPLVVGKEYVISMKAKATSTVSYNFWPGIIDGDTQYLPSFSADNKWEETSITFTANIPINRLRFCFGTFQGELCFDDVTLLMMKILLKAVRLILKIYPVGQDRAG